jgi:outer membrane protein OmpA-like peptidoglycan-associated protein
VKLRSAFVTTTIVVLSGCAAQPAVQPAPRLTERVILLPSDTERPSAVVVQSGEMEVLLDTPYTSADRRGSVLQSNALTAAEIKRRYKELLSAQPHKPQPFTMYFVLGSDELTAASKAAFDDARKRIASWSGAEVVVIGHTDRLGATDYNDRLSQQRASVIAARLVAAGVPADAIEVAARGEREPLIPTRDERPEPRNRRVEIKVR